MQTDQPGFKAVLFDLDGVIFDSRAANVNLYNHLMEAVGLPPTAEQHQEVIHRENMKTSLKHLMGDGPEYRKALEYWLGLDPSRFISALKLFPAVEETLALLARSHDLAVVTNRTKTTREALSYFGLLEHFCQITTPIEAGAPKPDQAMLGLTLERLNLNKDQVVYVGDSILDEALCQNCGVKMIAFRNPELTAWAHVGHFQEIPAMVNGHA